MKRFFSVLCLFLSLSAGALAQGGVASKIIYGATLPSTCKVGQVFAKTASPDAGMYYCSSNVWRRVPLQELSLNGSIVVPSSSLGTGTVDGSTCLHGDSTYGACGTGGGGTGGGAKWYNGVGAPSGATGVDGDYYLNVTTGSGKGDVYTKVSSVWGLLLNINGSVGVTGTPGSRWTQGSSTPLDSSGSDGDFYIRTNNGDMYVKASGTWTVQGNLTGPQGPSGSGSPGATWYTGSGAPSGGVAIDGDYYLNLTNGDVYKKVSGAWVLQGNIKGPAGNNGTNGTNGTAGSVWLSGSSDPTSGLGVNGDYYFQTAAGSTGVKGDVWLKQITGNWGKQSNITGATGAQGPQGTAGGSTHWMGTWSSSTAYQSSTYDAVTYNGSSYLATAPSTNQVPPNGAYWQLIALAGTNGINGNTWTSGAGVPNNAVGYDGDYDLNTTNGDVYRKASGAWAVIANIKGSTGATGATGATGSTGTTGAAGVNGATWYSGAGTPSDASGVQNDYYLNTLAGDVYKKGVSSWGSPTANIKTTWLSGSTDPAGGTGAVGDFYLQTAVGATGANGDVWKKTGASTWTKQTNLMPPVVGTYKDIQYAGSGSPTPLTADTGNFQYDPASKTLKVGTTAIASGGATTPNAWYAINNNVALPVANSFNGSSGFQIGPDGLFYICESPYPTSTSSTCYRVLPAPGSNGIVTRLSANQSGVASFADIVALFGSGACSGFLNSDGTCSSSTSLPAEVNDAVAIGVGGVWATRTLPDTGGGALSYSNTTHVFGTAPGTGWYPVGIDTGASGSNGSTPAAYIVSSPVTSYSAPFGQCFVATHTNTGATPYVNFNNLGALPIVHADGTAIAGSEILTTVSSCFLYDGTSALLLTNSGKTGTGPTVRQANGVLVTPRATDIRDGNGKVFIQSSATTNAVDAITVTTAATADPATVTIGATGTDTNINFDLLSKGTGVVKSNGVPVVTASSSAAAAKYVAVSGGADKTINYIAFPDVKTYPAANCVSTVAGAGWDTTLTPTCEAGTNNLGGYLPFVTTSAAQFDTEIPADWDTTVQPYIALFFESGANTSGAMTFTVATACTKSDGSVTSDPAYTTTDSFASKTMTTATRAWSTTVQMTHNGANCVAGGTMRVKIARSDAGGTALRVTKAVITTPRILTVQAD